MRKGGRKKMTFPHHERRLFLPLLNKGFINVKSCFVFGSSPGAEHPWRAARTQQKTLETRLTCVSMYDPSSPDDTVHFWTVALESCCCLKKIETIQPFVSDISASELKCPQAFRVSAQRWSKLGSRLALLVNYSSNITTTPLGITPKNGYINVHLSVWAHSCSSAQILPNPNPPTHTTPNLPLSTPH